jgi:hypothetical protein
MIESMKNSINFYKFAHLLYQSGGRWMGSQPLSQAPSVSTGANDSHAGDILAASTTIAGLATTIVVIFPAFPRLASFTLIQVSGRISITCGFALLLCGICAVLSASGAIYRLRQENNIPLLPMRSDRSMSLFMLFASLFCSFVIFSCVDIKYM